MALTEQSDKVQQPNFDRRSEHAQVFMYVCSRERAGYVCVACSGKHIHVYPHVNIKATREIHTLVSHWGYLGCGEVQLHSFLLVSTVLSDYFLLVPFL